MDSEDQIVRKHQSVGEAKRSRPQKQSLSRQRLRLRLLELLSSVVSTMAVAVLGVAAGLFVVWVFYVSLLLALT